MGRYFTLRVSGYTIVGYTINIYITRSLNLTAQCGACFIRPIIYIYIYYIPPPLTVHFPMTRSMRYQPILHTLYYMLHTEHAYCLSYRFLNNVVRTTVIEMVEMVEILDGRLGKRSVELVSYVINNYYTWSL